MDTREIDARIAEQVMGWLIESPSYGWPPHADTFIGQAPPRYSTTWEGMGAVIEAMRDAYSVEMAVSYGRLGVGARMRRRPHGPTDGLPWTYADTLPRAVALAALRAVAVEALEEGRGEE